MLLTPSFHCILLVCLDNRTIVLFTEAQVSVRDAGILEAAGALEIEGMLLQGKKEEKSALQQSKRG